MRGTRRQPWPLTPPELPREAIDEMDRAGFEAVVWPILDTLAMNTRASVGDGDEWEALVEQVLDWHPDITGLESERDSADLLAQVVAEW